ncbi:MAG: sulfatase-like hydrolase/transferase [Bacteroidia bacterium]|nr:sulfatase-like hydrolase/transferase [Bacteroidia bacterium]
MPKSTLNYLLLCVLLCHASPFLRAQTDPNHPNVLLIIADDLGVDASNGFQQNAMMPVTPVLDSLRTAGVTFQQVWAAPVCSPTRAAIMTGKYGYFNGVLRVPGNLDTAEVSIFRQLTATTNGLYSNAVIGKWHLSTPPDYRHPDFMKVQHYEGEFGGVVSDYYNWTKVNDGIAANETEYATANFTNSAIDWVNAQNQPWLLWLAHVAPHTPYHVPPVGTYTSTPVNNNRQKYIAMIENMDYEIGRLFQNIPANVLQNTVVIFLGDNGTPGNVIQNFPPNHGKETLYQGGIHVPMIVSGAGVSRQNEAEDALIQATDIFATIVEITGTALPGGMYQNSVSFEPLLSSATAPTRAYNYTELTSATITGWTVREERYKLIQLANGTQEFYDLWNDSLELNNLLPSLTVEQEMIKTDLEAEVIRIHSGSTAAAEPMASSLQLLASPNPNRGIFLLSFTPEPGLSYRIEVIDQAGRLVRRIHPTEPSPQGSISIDLSAESDGTYVIKVASEKSVDSISVVKAAE